MPKLWSETTMGEIGLYLNGRAFKEGEWSRKGRPIIRIQNLTGSNSVFNFFDGEVSERYLVRKGDLLFSWAATLGTYIWSGEEAILNQHIFKVESKINPRFHKYLLDFKIQEMYAQAHGTGMVHITKSKFDALPVSLPSIEEQEKIVEILDDHLSRIEAAEREIILAEKKLKLLMASTYEQIVSNSAPKHTLEELATDSRYGTSTKCTVASEGTPVVRIPNLIGGRIDLTDEKRASAAIDLSSVLLQEGDVLFVRTNGSKELIGRTAVVQQGVDASFASYLIKFSFDKTRLRPHWVHYLMNSPTLREQIQELAASSAGQFNLGLKKLNSLEIPLPKLEIQDELIAEIEEKMMLVRSSENSIQFSKQNLHSLRRSLLNSAFNGNLTNKGTDV